MIKLLYAIQIALLLSACSHSSERGAVVTAEIKGLEAGEMVSYAPESDPDKKETVPAEAGRFTLTIPVEAGQGDWYRIWVGSTPVPSRDLAIYLDSGNVHITSSGGGFANAAFSGCETAIQYNEVIRAVKQAGEDGAAAIQRWITDHPASPVSTALIQKYKSGVIPADTAIAYFNRLAPAATNNLAAQHIRDWMKETANIMPGKAAPAFMQPDTSGKPVSLKNFRGSYVLIDFWASWCGPCRAENPNLVKAYMKYKDKGFRVLGISLDGAESSDAWRAAIHKDQLPWIQVSDLQGWDNAVAKIYHIKSIPANFLINPEGVIIARGLRGEALERKLEEVL